MTHIVGGEVDGDLVDSVDGDGAAACGEVGADTKGVVERGTVDGDGGATVVAATGSEAATHHRGLRGELHDVVHATAGGGDFLNQTVVDGGVGTGVLDVHVAAGAFGGDRYRLEGGRSNIEFEVDHNGSAQRSIHVSDSKGLVAHHLGLDGVGAARDNTVDAVGAITVGEGMIGDSRGFVDRGNHRILQIAIGIGDVTGNGSGCRLGIGRCGEQHAEEDNKQTFNCLTHD